jgi:hypothetical protein
MSLSASRLVRGFVPRPAPGHPAANPAHAALFITAVVFIVSGACPASAASLSRSVDVEAPASDVWSAIGPFCAIRDWHPAIGSCSEDGKNPPTRTLVTKDGKATFVELRVGMNAKAHRYSYAFVSSPLPVHDYRSTLAVTAKDGGHARITWSGQYTPEPGKDGEAAEALGGIYDSGLQALKTRFNK